MHTKGKWIIDADDSMFVYATWEHPKHGLENRFSCRVQNDNHACSKEELQANARLIAAAPKLLEACQDIIDNANEQVDSGMVSFKQTILPIRVELIAKAEAAIQAGKE